MSNGRTLGKITLVGTLALVGTSVGCRSLVALGNSPRPLYEIATTGIGRAASAAGKEIQAQVSWMLQWQDCHLEDLPNRTQAKIAMAECWIAGIRDTGPTYIRELHVPSLGRSFAILLRVGRPLATSQDIQLEASVMDSKGEYFSKQRFVLGGHRTNVASVRTVSSRKTGEKDLMVVHTGASPMGPSHKITFGLMAFQDKAQNTQVLLVPFRVEESTKTQSLAVPAIVALYGADARSMEHLLEALSDQDRHRVTIAKLYLMWSILATARAPDGPDGSSGFAEQLVKFAREQAESSVLTGCLTSSESWIAEYARLVRTEARTPGSWLKTYQKFTENVSAD